MGRRILLCVVGFFLIYNLTTSNAGAGWCWCEISAMDTTTTHIELYLISDCWENVAMWFWMDLSATNAKENFATLLTAFANDYTIRAYFPTNDFTPHALIDKVRISK